MLEVRIIVLIQSIKEELSMVVWKEYSTGRVVFFLKGIICVFMISIMWEKIFMKKNPICVYVGY